MREDAALQKDAMQPRHTFQRWEQHEQRKISRGNLAITATSLPNLPDGLLFGRRHPSAVCGTAGG
jgi:hypothetical protein